jgi:ribosomal protein L20A (L18A)
MEIQVRWFEGYKKTYKPNPDEPPRIGPEYLWMDMGAEKKWRYVHVPVASVREIRSTERL